MISNKNIINSSFNSQSVKTTAIKAQKPKLVQQPSQTGFHTNGASSNLYNHKHQYSTQAKTLVIESEDPSDDMLVNFEEEGTAQHSGIP